MTPFEARGYAVLPQDKGVLAWVNFAHRAADAALSDPALAHWYQCENTWFVGVDALPTDPAGALAGGPSLRALRLLEPFGLPMPPLHPAQLSVIWKGYPKPREGENEAAFRYREKRFGAHVDGLIAHGPQKRRFVEEPHSFILGLPLNRASVGAAPLVVWPTSHHIMGQAFRAAFEGVAPQDMRAHDITDVYEEARRTVFETCAPEPVVAEPGQAILLHRHVLHGMAGWDIAEPALPEGRRIAYFRPECAGGVREWLGR